MEFATELFVGLLTALAWQVAKQPAKQNIPSTSATSAQLVLDFLVNVIVAFGAKGNRPCE